jgi:hypothetical protein
MALAWGTLAQGHHTILIARTTLVFFVKPLIATDDYLAGHSGVKRHFPDVDFWTAGDQRQSAGRNSNLARVDSFMTAF